MKEYIIDNIESKIRYHDMPGEDTPIIFIHGLGCAGSFDYPEVAAQKCLLNHRRILVDLLGSGFSDKPKNYSYTVQEHANYLCRFINDLNTNKCIIFGHSLGGAIAIELAQKCQNKLEALILSEANLDKSIAGSSSYKFGNCDEQEFISTQYYDEVKDNLISNSMWGATLSVCSPTAISRISKSAVIGVSPSWRDILYTLKCKRTFIFGEKSLPDIDEIELKKQGIHIEVVNGAGHSMAWENPIGLAQAIKYGISFARNGL